MNLDETGQRFSGVGRTLGLLCLVILAAAWTLQATPSLASEEAGDESQGEDAFDLSAIDGHPTTADDLACRYLRVAVQSPHGSDEDYQKPLRELLSTSLSDAGFEVVDGDESHYWWASSLALDTGSESAWTTVVRSVPEIRGGGIKFTTTYKDVAGKNVPFFGMHSLRLFHRKDAPETAMQIAGGIAQSLLPAVHQRCDKMVLAANQKAEAELERVRSELVEEIGRVRRNRAQSPRMKELKIEVEEQQTPQPRVSTEALPARPPGEAFASPPHASSPPASQSPIP